jgi:cell division septation protein DedD
VNESHEPSYYEIALTHRQVLVAFVVLLIALVAAFFTGVWVGKGGGGAPASVEAARPAPASPEAPLEEFRFFTEEGARPEGAPPAGRPAGAAQPRPAVPEPRPGTPLVAELRGESGAPPAAVSTPESSEAETPEEAEPEPAPAPRFETPPAAPAGASAADGLVVQVFSSPDGVQAQRILQRLVDGGYRAFLSPVQVGAQTMHRVRIGPFAERGEAQRVADQVRQRFRLDTWITR